MRPFWASWGIVAILLVLMPPAVWAQTLPCTRVDTNQLTAGAWVNAWGVEDQQADAQPDLAHATAAATNDAGEFGFAHADCMATAGCNTSQGAVANVPSVDTTVNSNSATWGPDWSDPSTDAQPSAGASTQFRVELDPSYPQKTTGTLNGSIYLLANWTGGEDNERPFNGSLFARCGDSWLSAQIGQSTSDENGWTITGVLQTPTGPVAVNDYVLGRSLNRLYVFAQPTQVGNVHQLEGYTFLEPLILSPPPGDVIWDGKASAWFEVVANP